ncbi:MAG: hypothetical protein P1U74_05605 [Legionellaceae bacterium]|nr:hypothetical protein [Legionellaceae bacterium]
MKKYKQSFAGDDSIDKMHEIIADNSERLSLSSQQIKEVQERKLKEIIAYAKEYSSWYRSRLSHIDVDKFTLADLEQIPIMNKRDVMENWDTIVTDKNINLNDAGEFLMNKTNYDLFHGYHLFASGGSSGRRGVFISDSDEIAESLAGVYQYQFRDDPYLKNSHEELRVVSVALTTPVYFSQTVFALPLLPNMQSLALSVLEPIEYLIEELNKYQPCYG